MVDSRPFLSDDPQSLPTSSRPLLDGAPSTRRRPWKGLAVIASGLLMIALLAAIIGSKDPQTHAGPNGFLSTSNDHSPAAAKPETIRPSSRGVSAGVSDKSNRILAGGNVQDFPWNNSMLSWQRTAFHFQPEKNWMNDPNGPLYYKGWYHFFYQYNPNGAVWGDIVWGHAVSKDLIHWLHLPLAMVADQWYDANGVWSGSATVLPDGRLIMLYTGSIVCLFA